MGLYQPEGLAAKPPRNHVQHPRAKGLIPTANTFHEAMDGLLTDPVPSEGLCCDDRMWTDHTVHYHFRVHEPIAPLCGLPLLIPTYPGSSLLRKLFAQGVRLKYVDIVIDTLHDSSNDLITQNTLAMIKHGMTESLRKEWVVVTTMSLDPWRERDLSPPFRQDSRRGCARAPPVPMSSNTPQMEDTHPCFNLSLPC